jgi:ribosome-associated translation inhibitor RaiA
MTLEFTFEFHSEVPDPGDELRDRAEERLLKLTEGHDDLIGASVTMEELTGETTPHRYEARVIVYKRPENVAAQAKAETPQAALNGALDAAERQVREMRTQLRETWR